MVVLGEILRIGEVRALVGAVQRRRDTRPGDAVRRGEDEQDDERRVEPTQRRDDAPHGSAAGVRAPGRRLSRGG